MLSCCISASPWRLRYWDHDSTFSIVWAIDMNTLTNVHLLSSSRWHVYIYNAVRPGTCVLERSNRTSQHGTPSVHPSIAVGVLLNYSWYDFGDPCTILPLRIRPWRHSGLTKSIENIGVISWPIQIPRTHIMHTCQPDTTKKIEIFGQRFFHHPHCLAGSRQLSGKPHNPYYYTRRMQTYPQVRT